MIPAPRLLIAGAVIAFGSVLPALDAGWSLPWLLACALLATLAIIDLFRVYRIRLHVARKVRNVLAHQEWSGVELTLQNTSGTAASLLIHDMHPMSCKTRGLPQKFNLDAQSEVQALYDVLPEQRGPELFDGVDCRVATGWALWYRRMRVACRNEVKVYPNFKANRLFGLLLSKQHLDHLGIRRLPRPGEGNDFHQLREYRDGDSLRQIDWKATARMQKIIAREYAQERDQQIVFLIDCSVRMRHRDEHSSHMDDTLNAVVLLSHVALQQGDASGIMTFGGVDRWIPPAKGTHAARHLMQGIYDIEATRQLPDYVQAVETLAQRVRRRALIILITNLRNEDGQSALQALQRLKGKHLVLMADLRETDLDIATDEAPVTADEALLWLSAENYRQQRKHQHRLAVAGGTRLLDVKPADLSADLITRYLAIKRLGQL